MPNNTVPVCGVPPPPVGMEPPPHGGGEAERPVQLGAVDGQLFSALNEVLFAVVESGSRAYVH